MPFGYSYRARQKLFARHSQSDSLPNKIRPKFILAEQDKTKVQKAMVKESLTRAFDELHAGKVHHVARKNDVSDNTAHIWDGYQLSAEVIAMAPGQRKSIYGDYKEEIAELLEEKYR